MGLASALSTALTGLTAAETTIDVVGNNLANANTVGFKASNAVFATQFLQTQSLGSGPSGNSGGTNPRQIGLGTQVAEITPDFTQGTIQISANPSDLAIQGDGFFIVQGTTGEQLYTRNGIFKTNSENQLVTVTGNRLLGFGVDDNFQLQTAALEPLAIPLGSAAVAQATQNVTFTGTLTPTGELADTAEIIQSAVLGDGQFNSPPTGTTNNVSLAPTLGTMAGAASGAGPLGPGSYLYRTVFVDASGNESPGSDLTVTLGAGPNGVDLNNIPLAPAEYVGRRIYRTEVGSSGPFYLVKDITDNTTTQLFGSPFGVDTTSDATLVTQPQFDASTLDGNYSYFITYIAPGVEESRPSPLIGPRNASNERILLSNFPPPSGDYAGGQVRIYRNLDTNSSTFFRVAEVNAGESFVDSIPDSIISNSSLPGFKALDFDGPKINTNTLLVDVVRRTTNGTYENPFVEGTLEFTGRKGGAEVSTREFTITATSTVQELVDFMTQAMGIQAPSADPTFPVPGDSSGATPGGSILTNGRIQFVGNNGVANAIDITNSSIRITDSTGLTETRELGFGSVQEAVGEGAVTGFRVFDSLGIGLDVRVTVVMESRDSSSTTYRWFADSADNDPGTGASIAVGTGLIQFDGEGNVSDVSNGTVSIQRSSVSSISPLEFELDFSQLSGLAATSSTLSATGQDGSGAGTLSSFIISENGTIRGVFTNGVTRTLGQIQLARFGNPAGLDQRGENLFAGGVNSGLPVIGNPGQQGIGSIVAGAVELSNADIGQNLIDLILASTQYRGNTRVVTAAQQLLDELLSLRR